MYQTIRCISNPNSTYQKQRPRSDQSSCLFDRATRSFGRGYDASMEIREVLVVAPVSATRRFRAAQQIPMCFTVGRNRTGTSKNQRRHFTTAPPRSNRTNGFQLNETGSHSRSIVCSSYGRIRRNALRRRGPPIWWTNRVQTHSAKRARVVPPLWNRKRDGDIRWRCRLPLCFRSRSGRSAPL